MFSKSQITWPGKPDRRKINLARLDARLNAALRAFWKDALTGFALYGQTMSGCAPADAVSARRRETGLDILLAVEQGRPGQPAMKRSRP